MKRITESLAVVIALLFAANSFAAGTQIKSGETIGSEDDDDADYQCVLLGERVSVSLSADVIAAFECEETTSAIDIATCHEAGQRATRTITCENFAAEGEEEVWNVDGCDADTTSVTVETSYTAYAASSTGGSVQQSPLDGSCDDEASNLNGLKIFN